MGVFDKAKDLYKMQKEARKIKKKLANIHIEAEADGVVITINGEQTVIKTEIKDKSLLSDQPKLETALTTAFNKAIKKSQEIAAEEMKDIMGNLGLSG